MEAFGIIAMSTGIIAWSLPGSLRNDLQLLEKRPQDSGLLKEPRGSTPCT